MTVIDDSREKSLTGANGPLGIFHTTDSRHEAVASLFFSTFNDFGNRFVNATVKLYSTRHGRRWRRHWCI